LSFEAGPEFEALLQYVRQSRGFDFTGYKRTTLLRRVGLRGSQVGTASFSDYLDYLQVHPEEFQTLFNTILINVTEFFRDPEAWDFLAREALPEILGRSVSDPIRVWSAGCASGEEAYSIAILLAEAMGENDFLQRVKIYATDVDEEALAAARTGYPATALGDLDEKLVNKYFDLQGSHRVFKPRLRNGLIFGRHDLIQDAPISRLDLLICRNTLMYFTAESQDRVLTRFHYALKDDGYLFLGKAEMLLTHAKQFAPLDMKNRVFTKVRRRAEPRELPAPVAPTSPGADDRTSQREVRVRELATDLAPVAQVTIDAAGRLVAANQVARSIFKIGTNDLGTALKDLELSYRPVELRANLAKAAKEHRPVVVKGAEHKLADGSLRTLDVEITPILDLNHSSLGTTVTFTDVTEFIRLRSELERSRQDIETAYAELQASNEELETTNEELQSTVEELETTNEELQSSNEELETMNEELESTNAELQTINTDLRLRTDEIDRLNVFVESVLGSVEVGIAVLDADLRVAKWNARAEDLWGVRSVEVLGRSFYQLDIGLPVEALRPLVKLVASGEAANPIDTVTAINRRGKSIRCRVSMTPLVESAIHGRRGVVLLMEDLAGKTVERMPRSKGAPSGSGSGLPGPG